MSETIEDMLDLPNLTEQSLMAVTAPTRARRCRTKPALLLAHIHAAYQQLQASLSTLAHNTRSQEHRVNIGAAQQDLDRWHILHWNNITEPRRKGRKV
jgi:hypothetical protein